MVIRCFALAWVAASVYACGDGPVRYRLDGELRLNQVQARGTHNSYHLEPADPVDESHRYSHLPLGRQLAELGVRQVELDLHLRTGVGFEVFHLPGGVDEETGSRSPAGTPARCNPVNAPVDCRPDDLEDP